MAPKKSPTSEEVDEIKKSLDFLVDEVSIVKQQQKAILAQVEEVKTLRLQNTKKEKIAVLENQVAELEQYTWMNNIIITGLKTKLSYAQASLPVLQNSRKTIQR